MLFAENGRDISKKTMTFQIWRGTKYKKKQLGVAIHQMDSDASPLYAPGIEKWMFHFSDFYGFINLSGSLGQFLRRAPSQVSRPSWGRSWGGVTGNKEVTSNAAGKQPSQEKSRFPTGTFQELV